MKWNNWWGWAAFGAILMMTVGVFQVISGIWGLVNDQWIVQGYAGYFVVDMTGLSIWYICIGAVVLLGGIAAVQGRTLGRVIGIIAASLGVISQLFAIPVHPVWSVLLIFAFVMALIGFVVVRQPLDEPEEGEVKKADIPARSAIVSDEYKEPR